jgi:hypothetical protein
MNLHELVYTIVSKNKVPRSKNSQRGRERECVCDLDLHKV